MVGINITIHKNINKGFCRSNDKEIALELSKDLEKETIVYEIKYTLSQKNLKITLSEYTRKGGNLVCIDNYN